MLGYIIYDMLLCINEAWAEIKDMIELELFAEQLRQDENNFHFHFFFH